MVPSVVKTRDKVSALKKVTPPTSKQELHAFLGSAAYMGPFIHSLTTLTLRLRELFVKDGSIFDWSPAHQEMTKLRMPSVPKEHRGTTIPQKK